MAFRYPTGARPLLVAETARRRRIESRIVALLEQAGFAEVVVPVIDFAEPYAAVTDRDTVRNSYRFTDRDGELVSVRADFTPMVARALAPSLTNLPLRVFYRGDVVRCEASRLGANRELFQIGAELIGDGSPEADDEMMQIVTTIASEIVGVRNVVRSYDEPSGYYTGLRFWVYGADRRTVIARGGRYDTLYGRFGISAPAIGFTLTVDEVED